MLRRVVAHEDGLLRAELVVHLALGEQGRHDVFCVLQKHGLRARDNRLLVLELVDRGREELQDQLDDGVGEREYPRVRAEVLAELHDLWDGGVLARADKLAVENVLERFEAEPDPVSDGLRGVTGEEEAAQVVAEELEQCDLRRREVLRARDASFISGVAYSKSRSARFQC